MKQAILMILLGKVIILTGVFLWIRHQDGAGVLMAIGMIVTLLAFISAIRKMVRK